MAIDCPVVMCEAIISDCHISRAAAVDSETAEVTILIQHNYLEGQKEKLLEMLNGACLVTILSIESMDE